MGCSSVACEELHALLDAADDVRSAVDAAIVTAADEHGYDEVELYRAMLQYPLAGFDSLTVIEALGPTVVLARVVEWDLESAAAYLATVVTIYDVSPAAAAATTKNALEGESLPPAYLEIIRSVGPSATAAGRSLEDVLDDIIERARDGREPEEVRERLRTGYRRSAHRGSCD